jgi:hypothetical protein
MEDMISVLFLLLFLTLRGFTGTILPSKQTFRNRWIVFGASNLHPDLSENGLRILNSNLHSGHFFMDRLFYSSQLATWGLTWASRKC